MYNYFNFIITILFIINIILFILKLSNDINKFFIKKEVNFKETYGEVSPSLMFPPIMAEAEDGANDNVETRATTRAVNLRSITLQLCSYGACVHSQRTTFRNLQAYDR